VIATIRAFAWLRWRVLVNSFERTGARDTLERFSIAAEKLGPLIVLGLLVPSAVALAALGLVAGYGLATGEWRLPFELIRYFALIATFMTILGPIVMPSRDVANPVRFLLLPIHRGVLFAAQAAGAIADPWILLLVPAVVLVPVGLLAGGAMATAAVAALAGVALLLFAIGITALVSSLIHLLLRDRRRGDLVMLFVVLVLPLAGALPALFETTGRDGSGRRARHAAPAWIERAAARTFAYTPSELYHRSVATGTAPGSARAAALLAAADAIVLTLGFVAYGRLLDMPASMTARRAGSFGGLWGRTLPGLGPGASAVAWTQVRLALRTPRGRAILGAPLIMFAVFATLAQRMGGFRFGPAVVTNGLPMASAAGFLSLLTILPFAMNQFAIDRAGTTRQLLSPLSVGELLAGKAVGNGLIVAGPATVCLAIAALLFDGSTFALWVSLPIALVATYAIVSPIAAALSAAFPRAVDLNSIGNASNAHPAAGLLGLVAFLLSAAPAGLIAILATGVLHRPAVTPVLMLAWAVVSLTAARLLFIPVGRLVARRAESLSPRV
jgi:hypothetical protein